MNIKIEYLGGCPFILRLQKDYFYSEIFFKVQKDFDIVDDFDRDMGFIQKKAELFLNVIENLPENQYHQIFI
jgi:hypothetical protein